MEAKIHLDHCRVHYTKDRFERSDPAWDDMRFAVRGQGPLRPEKASGLAFSGNNSPLYKLYQVFRRSTPRSKTAPGWKRMLVVPDNDRAKEMAEKFQAGEAGYETDDKWFELVEEADRAALTAGGKGGGGRGKGGGGGALPGFGGQPGQPQPSKPPPPTVPETPLRSRADACDLTSRSLKVVVCPAACIRPSASARARTAGRARAQRLCGIAQFIRIDLSSVGNSAAADA